MDSERFEELVVKAVESLPEEFLERMENIDIVVEDWPTPEQVSSADLEDGNTLLGLYEGIPVTQRSSGYGTVLPDKISIFRGPMEDKCGDNDSMTAEIQRVVRHELAHHFGIGDDRLMELEGEEEE
ncbi:MAG: metallopeptidase family protein [Chloroflexi bacterium]|nr:metallopeptidase family protein [Chloroflexota bacterium]